MNEKGKEPDENRKSVFVSSVKHKAILVSSDYIWLVLLVEFKVRVLLLDVGFVALLEVLAENDIAVLADGMHTSFLADGCDFGTRKLVRARDN